MDRTELATSDDKWRELAVLVDRGQASPEELQEFRRSLRHLRQPVTRIAAATADTLIGSMSGESKVCVEVIRHDQEAMLSELGHATAPPLEKLLIEAVVLAWLRYNDLEARYTAKLSETHSFDLAEHWESRVSAAQRRYLRAIETLARVRRLAVPALQLNIGQQQVNQVKVG